MRWISCVALSFLAVSAAISELGAQSDEPEVRRLLRHADSELKRVQFSSQPPSVRTLEAGMSLSSSFPVRAGHDYVIVALCGERCDAAEVSVASRTAVLAAGVPDGPFSVASLRATSDAAHSIRVRMVRCAGPACTVAYQVFERSSTMDLRVCVEQDGALTEVVAQYDPAIGDTTVAGRPFAEAYPSSAPTYAAGTAWFVGNEPIELDGRDYQKYGLPRVLGVADVVRAGEYRGTTLFSEEGNTEMVYVPVRTGCEFQPYQRSAGPDGDR